MDSDDLPTEELQKFLRKANETNIRDMNKSLRGSSDEFVPMVIPMNVGGMRYLAHPIGAAETGAGFMDYLPLPLKIPMMMAKAVANKVIEKVSGGKCKKSCKKSCKVCKGGQVAETVEGGKKPRKPRAKKDKGGSLLSTIGNVANMFGLPKTPLEELAGPELTKQFKDVAYDIVGKKIGLGKPKKAAGPKKANPWLSHVKAEKAKHPGKSFKEVLQLAKLSYKK